MMAERVIRIGIVGLVLVLGGLARPQEAPGYSICIGCVGWASPVQGSATLSYYFGPLTHDNGLTDSLVKDALVSAMTAWSSVAAITWAETPFPHLPRSVDMEWDTGTYGLWGAPFPPGVLAVAFYPAPQNFEPIAGDIYFNDAFSWSVGGGPGMDILSVALHELGHALGLAHSDNPSSVMYAYYHPVTGLSADDIAGIRSLYAAAPQPGVNFDALNNPVPEPGTLLLVGLGLVGLGSWGRGLQKDRRRGNRARAAQGSPF